MAIYTLLTLGTTVVGGRSSAGSASTGARVPRSAFAGAATFGAALVLAVPLSLAVRRRGDASMACAPVSPR